ncbi:MAG: hypothetical protein ABI780_00905 [Ardenticatenales bacterium]
MLDRLDERWLDALAAGADADAAARLADQLADDPEAADAFDGWQRLAAAVRVNAERRSGPLPSLAPVLTAIRTPASSGGGATPNDALGRATLQRLAAQPMPGAPHPVPGWVVAGAAAAAVLLLALWPTPRGPLGGVFLAAVRQRAPLARIDAPSRPTAIARLGDPAAILRASAAGAAGHADLAPAVDYRGAAARATRDAAAGSGAGVDGVGGALASAGVAPIAGGVRPPRRSTTLGAAAGVSGQPARIAAPPADGSAAAYPGPSSPSSAYPAPPPAPAGRNHGGPKPSKPPVLPTEPPTPVPTTPPTEPTATPTPAFHGLIGRVTGADGGGRAQVRIAAYRAEDAPVRDSWVETFTADATGAYTLSLDAGAWLLFLEAPGHRPRWWSGADRPEGGSQIVVGDDIVTLDAQLSATDGGDGLLVGEAAPNALVRAVQDGQDVTAVQGPSTLADSAGRFTLPLPAGRWSVAASDDGRGRGWRVLPEAVDAIAGASTIVSWP